MFTRLPILLAQIKAGNNSYKLKNKIRKILYYVYTILYYTILYYTMYQHNRITKKLYKNLINSL